MSDDRIREMELDPETPAVYKKEVKIFFWRCLTSGHSVAMQDIIYVNFAFYLFLL